MFYADDAVFVGQWCDGNINTLVHVLECFFQASGLRINMYKSKIMRVNVGDEKVKSATSKLGCLILNTLFSYLGTKVGGNMSRVQAWTEVVDKALWVKWKSVLASKEKGGIRVSSLYALNRALMMKWVWRFYSQKESLWARVIKAIYGNDRQVGKVSGAGSRSCWRNIVNEVRILSNQGIKVLDYMWIKLGNGESTAIWDDNWIGGKVLKSPILWVEIGESRLIVPELMQKTTDNLVLIKEKLKAVIDRQKSFVDHMCKTLEFEVGDKVLLKKFLAAANLHVPLDYTKVDKTLCFVEEPIEIMDREVKSLKSSKIYIIKDEIPKGGDTVTTVTGAVKTSVTACLKHMNLTNIIVDVLSIIFRSKEDDVSRISTSIYVLNFPESFFAKDLFNSCKQYGHVVDTFIPFKKSKDRKMFGFVCFINVFNVKRLVSNLCTIWVDRSKFHVNIARFHRAPLNNNKVPMEQKFGYNRNINNVRAKEGVTTGSSKSYVHAVKVKNMFRALKCDSKPSF
nr:RNA-directed DNA polymerase, eukaryota, reverse transcriptase zinc-binding domain protein [Tanacetum cinerariifolium]